MVVSSSLAFLENFYGSAEVSNGILAVTACANVTPNCAAARASNQLINVYPRSDLPSCLNRMCSAHSEVRYATRTRTATVSMVTLYVTGTKTQ